MPTVIGTSTSSTPTWKHHQRKIDRCQNGVLWAFFNPLSTASSINAEAWYSTDGGVTWTQDSSGSILTAGGGDSNTVEFSVFIDLDDYCHVVYLDRVEVKLYYRRGTPNAGRTAWTWSSPVFIGIDASEASRNQCADIIAHREGTGWKAHIAYQGETSLGTTNYGTRYARINITSSHVISKDIDSYIGAYSTTTGPGSAGFPSIDFYHTGDGKTVAGGTPHVYIVEGGVSAGANFAIGFFKLTYSAGAWSIGSKISIDADRYIATGDDWINGLFDGTRLIVGAGRTVSDTGSKANNVMLYQVDVSTDAVTTTVLLDNSAGGQNANDIAYGCIAYDINTKDIYYIGRENNSVGVDGILHYRKWTRATATFESPVTIDATVRHTYTSAKRNSVGSKIEWVYRDGSSSPFSVTYGSININATPNVPTALTVTSDVLDTTPTFSASISDPDSSQQIKGRFQIYQSDGTTLVGTVDSALRTGAGSVTAEYASALPVGTYKVQVATVDDLGAISAYTAQVTFNVKTQVTDDSIFRWDVDELIVDSLTVRWNVIVSNQKDLSLPWNVKVPVQANDLTFRWAKYTPWVTVDPDPQSPVTWEEVPA